MSEKPMHCERCTNPGVVYSGPTVGKICEFSLLDGRDVPMYNTGEGNDFVILCTDIFGYNFPNCHRNADEIAAAGFNVIVVDYLRNDPMPWDPNAKADFAEWCSRHDLKQCIKLIEDVSETLWTQDGGCTISYLGYCWGAAPVINMLNKSHPQIKGGIIAHPSRLADVEAHVVKPVHFLAAETDPAFEADEINRWQTGLGQLMTISKFPGTHHGFASRPLTDEESAQRSRAMTETIKVLKDRFGRE